MRNVEINNIQADWNLSFMRSRATRGLYDTGADDCTTNDPFIIHDLSLLPEGQRTTLYDAGKNPSMEDMLSS